MSRWACGINGCGVEFESAEAAIVHQATEHDRQECAVCGTVVPDGYFAIRHAIDEHTRAEFVRAYDADSDDVRHREQVKSRIEEQADLEAVIDELRDRGVLG